MWIAMKIDINVSWNDNLYIYIAGFNAYDKGGKILLLFREREKERESQTDRQIVERQVGTHSQSETHDFFSLHFCTSCFNSSSFFSLDFSFSFPLFFPFILWFHGLKRWSLLTNETRRKKEVKLKKKEKKFNEMELSKSCQGISYAV